MTWGISLREAKELRDALQKTEDWGRVTANFQAYRHFVFSKISITKLPALVGLEKISNEVSNEDNIESLIKYRTLGNIKTGVSYPLLIGAIISEFAGLYFNFNKAVTLDVGLPLDAALIYLNWRGESEFVPAEQKIKLLTERETSSLEDEIERLETKLYAKQKEKPVRYFNAALNWMVLEAPVAALIFGMGYAVSRFFNPPAEIPFYMAGTLISMAVGVKIAGASVRHNMKKEESEIKMELGNAYLQANQFDKAAKNYQQALKLQPKLIKRLTESQLKVINLAT